MEEGPILTGAPETINFENIPYHFYNNQIVVFLVLEMYTKKPNWKMDFDFPVDRSRQCHRNI